MQTDPNKIFPPLPAGFSLPFYEPTFVTTFNYTVPDINDPAQKSWDVTCNDPTDAKQFIFTLHAEANPPGLAKSAMSPIMQYTRDPIGNVFAYTWNVFGAFESALAARLSSSARAPTRWVPPCSLSSTAFPPPECRPSKRRRWERARGDI